MAGTLPEVTLMEVCGTHTHQIRRLGIREVLPPNIRLVSGPGCPVCVTSQTDIFRAVSLAEREDVILCTFGDMMRVPCCDKSLYSCGGNTTTVVSPLQTLTLAEKEPGKQVVFFAVGFETTTPNAAALAEAAKAENIKNLSILTALKTMPAAIKTVLGSGCHVDGLICPGHVAAVTGRRTFDFVADELGIPAAVTGFEAEDILLSVFNLLSMISLGDSRCVNLYPAAVRESGNTAAKELVRSVLEPCDAEWRGMGIIPGSGMKLNDEYAGFDALNRFEIPDSPVFDSTGCLCGKILKGELSPSQCPNFGGKCTPATPLGPCMVSSEGSCAAEYLYR